MAAAMLRTPTVSMNFQTAPGCRASAAVRAQARARARTVGGAARGHHEHQQPRQTGSVRLQSAPGLTQAGRTSAVGSWTALGRRAPAGRGRHHGAPRRRSRAGVVEVAAGLRWVTSTAPAPAPGPPPVQVALGWVGVSLGAAVSVFLLALIPVLQAVREAVNELTELIVAVRLEVPDTAAAVRLPALEITDTVEEVGALGSEITGGIRSSARAVSAASDLATSGGEFLAETVVHEVLPRARQLGKRVARNARDTLVEAAAVNAGLEEYSEPLIASTAATTRDAVSKVRKAAVGAKAARAVAGVVRQFRT